MKVLSNYKRSLSVALAACFNFVPSLDAGEMEVYQLVNSISGLLGGSYQIDSSGAYNGPMVMGVPSAQTWGSGTPAGITSNVGSLLAGSQGGTANASGYGSGDVNNPYPGGGSGNYNLYGKNGLLEGYNYNYSTDTFYNIYNFPSLGSWISSQRALNQVWYQNRLTFGGLPDGANNMLKNLPAFKSTYSANGGAVLNHYYTINGVAAQGNLTQSQLKSTVTPLSANTLLGDIYSNIQAIADNIQFATGLTPSNYNTYYNTAFTAIQDAGATLLAALGGGVTSGSFTSADLSALTAAAEGAGALITGTGTSVDPYKFNATALTTLEAYNGINTLMGGAAFTTGGVSANLTSLNALLANTNSTNDTYGDIAAIVNNTLNTGDPSITQGQAVQNVISAIQTLDSQTSSRPNLGQVAGALKGLVNPAAYAAVYNAYVALKNGVTGSSGTAGSYSFSSTQGSVGVGSFTAASPAVGQTTANWLSKIQGFTGAGSIGEGLQRALWIKDLIGVGNVSVTSTNAGAALNGPYQALMSLLKTAGLVDSSTNYTPTSKLNSQNINVTSSGPSTSPSPTNKVPVSKTASAAPANGNVQSWAAGQGSSQVKFNSSLATALSNILSPALNYANNAATLKGMLADPTTLQTILNVGVNNAVSASDLTTNGPAQTLSNIKAIFYSEDLLGTYVGAVTAPQSGQANLSAQGSALNYLNGALNASLEQNGLIAQTKNAIQGLLNQSFNLTGVSSEQLSADLSSVSSNTFLNTATPAQLAQGIGALYALSQLKGGNINPSNTTFNATNLGNSLTAINALGASTITDAVSMLANSKIVISKTMTGSVLAAAQSAGLVPGETINSGNVANFLAAAQTLGYTAANNGTGLIASVNGTTGQLTTSNGGSAANGDAQAALKALVGTGAVDSSSAAAKAIGAIATTTNGAQALKQAFSLVSSVTNTTSNQNFTSAAVTALNNILPSADRITNNANNVGAPSSATALNNLLQKAPQIVSDLSLLGPSIAKQFANGTLKASDLSNVITAMRADFTPGYSLDISNTGTTDLSAGLTSLIAPNVSVPQNLGIASAAAYTIYNQIDGVSSMLNQSYGSTFLGTGTGGNNSSTTALTALGTLQTAVQALWNTNPKFFGQSTTYNLTTVSNLGNSNGALNNIAGSSATNYSGVTGVSYNGISNTNAPTYLKNLQSINTISTLLGSLVQNGNASTNYTAALSNNGNNYNSLAYNVNDNGQVLSSALKPGVQLSALVQALINIPTPDVSQTVDGVAYAPVVNAIKDLTLSGTSAQAIWDAYHTLTTTTPSSGGVSYVQGLYNILKGVNSNMPSLTTGSGDSVAPNASAIAQVIQDGMALQQANAVLTNGTTGVKSTNGIINVTGGLSGNISAFQAAQTAAQALGALMGYLKPGMQSAANVQTFIKALDAYNHNLSLLNNLTNGKGAQIATNVVSYANANQAANKYTGSGVSLSNLNTLQTLVNRLQYLETLQGQVQSAINNNPYALVMEKNNLQNSAGYQSALSGLFTVGTNSGLLNSTLSDSIASVNSSGNIALSSGASATLNTLSTDLGNISTWNELFNGVNGQSGVFIPGISYSTQIATQMGNVLSAVDGMVSTFNGDTSGTLTSTITDLLNLYYTPSSRNQNGTGLYQKYQAFVAANTSSTLGALNANGFNITGAGSATGALTLQQMVSPGASDSPSPWQTLQDLTYLQTTIKNGVVAGTSGTDSSNGTEAVAILGTNFVGTGASGIYNTATTGLNALVSGVAVAFAPAANGSTKITTTNPVYSSLNNVTIATTTAPSTSAANLTTFYDSGAAAGTQANGSLLVKGLITALDTNTAVAGTTLGALVVGGKTALTAAANSDANKLAIAKAVSDAVSATMGWNLNSAFGIADNTAAATWVAANWGTGLKVDDILGNLLDALQKVASDQASISGLVTLNDNLASKISLTTASNQITDANQILSLLGTATQIAQKAAVVNAQMGSSSGGTFTPGLSGWITANKSSSNATTWIGNLTASGGKISTLFENSIAPAFTVAASGVTTPANNTSRAPVITPALAAMQYANATTAANVASNTPNTAQYGNLVTTNRSGQVVLNWGDSADATGIAGLTTGGAQVQAMIAAQIVLDLHGTATGQVSVGNLSVGASTTVHDILQAATPEQIYKAALSVFGGGGANATSSFNSTNTTNWTSGAAQKLMTTIQDSVTSAAVSQAYNYVTAMQALQPILSSGNTSESAQAVLQAAVNNAVSMQSLLKMLNATYTLQTGTGDGATVTLGNLKSAKSLSPAVVSAIKALLSKYTTEAGKMQAINSAIASNPQAQQLEGTSGAGGVITELNNAISQVQAGDMSISAYVNLVNQYVSDASNYIQNTACNGGACNVRTILYNLKEQFAAQAGSFTSQLANMSAQLNALYNTITGTGLTFSTGEAAINNAISALTGLQQQLLQSLASGGGGNQDGDNMQRITKGDPRAVTRGTQAIVLKPLGNISQLTSAQKIAALKAIQNALAFANAAKTKYADNGASFLANRVSSAPAPKSSKMAFNNSSGNMYGVDVQFGYKQFFGKKKRFGLRYYAHFSYQHGTFMDGAAGELDNFVYGAGVDALYNFYESKDAKYTSGLFAGLILAGSTWNVQGASYYKGLMADINASGGKAVMNTSYFQVPLNIGFRTNVSKHHGFEIGLRIPLAVNYYFKGTFASGLEESVSYKRNVSVFFNYVYNF
ncbi:outer membrane protein [Helicobacter salomonis]|uniref:OMP1303 n=1 Tax=Helicobacter salomonis TaxID=56878 RepID=A0A1M4NIZ0_9HELI|nr:outer membrane protein [Helicobacter salomonis]SFZ73152.1 OMP1303 [Helicobacter salomonis]